jgi:hypothetical protein
MNRIAIVRFVACFVIVAVSAVPAFAGGKKAKATPVPFVDTVITSVSPASISITEGAVAKTYAINNYTEITFKGQRATAADLKSGMAVSVVKGMDPAVASKIIANPPPTHPAAPSKPGKSSSGKGH